MLIRVFVCMYMYIYIRIGWIGQSNIYRQSQIESCGNGPRCELRRGPQFHDHQIPFDKRHHGGVELPGRHPEDDHWGGNKIRRGDPHVRRLFIYI